MENKTIRVSKANYERLIALDKTPDRAISVLFGSKDNAITKVINTMLEEVRAIFKEELEKVRS